MARRGAPYRPQARPYARDASSNDWPTDGSMFPPWSQSNWIPPKRDTQPLPPGEVRPPQRFGSTPDPAKIRCFSCFKFGHKSPNCPDKQSQ